MTVEVYNGIGPPLVLEATQVVVRNEFGEPINFVVQLGPRQYDMHSAAHEPSPEFNGALADAGITGTIFVKDVKVQQPIIVPGQ